MTGTHQSRHSFILNETEWKQAKKGVCVCVCAVMVAALVSISFFLVSEALFIFCIVSRKRDDVINIITS